MERASLPHHLKTCPSVTLLCRNSDSNGDVCNVKCNRSELSVHQSSCAMMTVECNKGCGCFLCVKDVPSHNSLSYLRQEKQNMKDTIASLATAMATVTGLIRRIAVALSFVCLLLTAGRLLLLESSVPTARPNSTAGQ